MGQIKTAAADELQVGYPSCGEVHIWYASLDRPDFRFIELLSEDEKERAGRLIFEHDRLRYITRRSILRLLLGKYLGADPDDLCFDYSNNGKPALVDRWKSSGLHFNISRSEDKAVFAFSDVTEIGVDIENIRDIPDMEQIFKRFFSPAETRAFQMLPDVEKLEAFFNCWTRKEAFIKATGAGLSQTLSGFSVSITLEKPVRLLEIGGDVKEASGWFLDDLHCASNYKAALALRGLCSRICTRELDGACSQPPSG